MLALTCCWQSACLVGYEPTSDPTADAPSRMDAGAGDVLTAPVPDAATGAPQQDGASPQAMDSGRAGRDGGRDDEEGPEGGAGEKDAGPSGLATSRCAPASPLCAGLLAHWRLDGDATDDLGWYHGETLDEAADGTLVFQALPYVSGPADQAVDLSTDLGRGLQHIRVVADAPDALTPGPLDPEQLTLSFWMRRGEAPFVSDEYLVGKGRQCQSHYGCRLRQGADQLRCSVHDGTDWCEGMVATDFVTISPSAWHHVAFTVERPGDGPALRLRLYLDGALATFIEHSEPLTGSGVNTDFTQPILFGRNYYVTEEGGDLNGSGDYAHRFQGQLSDVRLYNRVLSADEVAELYRTSGG